MSSKIFVAGLVASALVLGSSGVDATCGTNEPMCGEAPMVISNNICIDQALNFTMDSCCSADSLTANECPKDPQGTCRVVELRSPFAPGTESCCAQMQIELDWYQTTSSCCKTCSCFGDPHCVSFYDQVDSWVICDGRVKNPDASFGNGVYCPIVKSQCDKELDQNGEPCVYKDNGKQTTDANGSPCKSASSPPGSINMYQIPNFQLVLGLGDRAIISNLVLTDGTTNYYLNAQTCATSNMPWRANQGDNKPPTDPNWLPYSWKSSNIPGGKAWAIDGLVTGVQVELHCVFNSGGSLPRINVDSLQDPALASRKSPAGVCVTGKIDKGKSTYQHTYDINKFCQSTQTQGEAVEYFCSAGANPVSCMKSMCARITSNSADAATCVANVQKYQSDKAFQDGWERVWCSANILIDSDPAKCTAGDCLQCMYDVYDFGWAETVKNWKGSKNNLGPGVGGGLPCIPQAELNTSLTECQSGVTIQYLDTNGLDENGDSVDCWHDFKAIPYGRKVCEGAISLSTTSNDPAQINLFDKQIRIVQCNNDAVCGIEPKDPCTPELGINGKITLAPYDTSNRAQLYWQLIREGKLVCSDGSGTECLKATYGSQTQAAICSGCDYCVSA